MVLMYNTGLLQRTFVVVSNPKISKVISAQNYIAIYCNTVKMMIKYNSILSNILCRPFGKL